MNRGFGFYFANAIKSSAKTLWHKGNLIKYFVWVLMEILAPLTLVLGAMFSLASVRQAKIAERQNVIDVPQSFKVACKAKPFWTMFLATVLEGLIFLAGAILIIIAGALLALVGYAISSFVDTVEPQLLTFIFFAPCLIVLLVYSVIMPILMAPTAYVIETNPDLGAADAISICFNTMKSRGKGTCFLNFLIPALVEGAIIGLGVAIGFVVMNFVSDTALARALVVLVAIIFFVGFALVAPMFALARNVSNKNLFEDIVLDPVNASKHTSGVNIKKCKGVKFDPVEYENELALLFDETYSDRIPVPETPSAKRKRELEERKAARAASVDYTKTLLEDDAPAYTPAPVKTAEAGEEEDGELLTVSDLIRDVETAEPAKPEEPVAEEPVKEDEPAKVEPAQAEEPVTADEPAEEQPAGPAKTEEPVKEEPVKKTAKTTVKATAKVADKPATKSTATKTAATKSTATKTATKTATAAKPAATKTTVKAKTAEKPATATKTSTVKAKTTTSKSTAKKQ